MLRFLSKRTSLVTVSLSALFLVLGTTQLTAGDDEKVSIRPPSPKKIPDPLILKYAAKPFSLYRVTGDGACFYTAIQEPRSSLVQRIIDEVKYDSSGKKSNILKEIGKMISYLSFQEQHPSLKEETRAIKFMREYISNDPLGEAEFAVMKAILDGNKNIFVWRFHDKELPVMLSAHHLISEDADNFHIYHTPGHFSFLASPVDKDYPRQRALGQLIEEAYLKPEKIISKEKIDERMGLEEFLGKQNYPNAFKSLRATLPATCPDAEIVGFLMTSNKYPGWTELDPDTQGWVFTKITGKSKRMGLDRIYKK